MHHSVLRIRQFSGAKNLEFLIGLRNKIEHRHLPELDPSLFGECQASLLNLESLSGETFGTRYAMMDELALAMQLSQVVTGERARANKRAILSASRSVTDYIEQFRGALPNGVRESMRYSFSVFLVPRTANRESSAEAAVTFVRVDEASKDELERLEKLNVLIREKQVPIVNLGMYKPGDVVKQLRSRGLSNYTMEKHTQAWRRHQVRPRKDAQDPHKTDFRYCVYDVVHEDYMYTKAWVDRLVQEA